MTKTRSRVFIDEEFAFVLYKGELRLYHIAPGEEVAPEDYEAIVETVLPRRAKLRAMNLLKNKEYTSKQLYDKLKDGGYPEKAAAEALTYVESFHYIDDLRYAVNFITYHEDTRSHKKIEQDLLDRGISRETLKKAFEKWTDQGGEQDERAMIRELLKKRGYDPETADLKEKRRQGAFLMRKGFSGEYIRSVLFGSADEEF